MAMTKREQAEMDALREARDMARALRWPTYEIPELLPIPTDSTHFTQGFGINTYRAVELLRSSLIGDVDGCVFEAWSERNSHGRGQHPATWKERMANGSTQGGVELFTTRADAIKALRIEVTIRVARLLIEIDDGVDAASGSGE